MCRPYLYMKIFLGYFPQFHFSVLLTAGTQRCSITPDFKPTQHLTCRLVRWWMNLLLLFCVALLAHSVRGMQKINIIPPCFLTTSQYTYVLFELNLSYPCYGDLGFNTYKSQGNQDPPPSSSSTP